MNQEEEKERLCCLGCEMINETVTLTECPGDGKETCHQKVALCPKCRENSPCCDHHFQ